MSTSSLNCPRCLQAELIVTDRHEIEIDVCPTCRGVWLDRGELDKLVERSLSMRGPVTAGRVRDDDDDDDDDHRPPYGRPRHQPNHDETYYPRRKKSWLSELFD